MIILEIKPIDRPTKKYSWLFNKPTSIFLIFPVAAVLIANFLIKGMFKLEAKELAEPRGIKANGTDRLFLIK
ncbi:hypothetical protein A2483_01125 [Candidatus Peregrinibacteria bacterium RIFOXYC2_FULL_33_13]|nr:MAG: hypothetical protein A2483_01125 [Candidatus Peregrinibacteria bacterium RIFOXYC2_FULL_33_13]